MTGPEGMAGGYQSRLRVVGLGSYEDRLLVALCDMTGRLDELNRLERECGLPGLHEQPLGMRDRAAELMVRVQMVGLMVESGADVGAVGRMLDAIGAHVLAFKVAIGAEHDREDSDG